MEKQKKTFLTSEVKIGIVVVLTIAILYFGLNYLKGINIFTPNSRYYVQYERVDGIVKTTHVLINGYQVGHVSDIRFDYSKEAPVTLELTLDKKLAVPQGTIAEVYETGLLGDKAIQLHLGPGPGMCTPGDTLQAAVQNGMLTQLVDAIVPSMQNIMPELDSTVQALRTILEDGNIKKIVANTENLTADLKYSSDKLKILMSKDVPSAVQGINNLSGSLTGIASDLGKVDLDSTMMALDSTINNLQYITARLKSPDNTLGALFNDSTLYQNMDSTVRSANQLLIDLKANPKRYVHFSVFGGKDKKEKK